jgi:glutaredoxin
MSAPNSLSPWGEILTTAQSQTPARRVKRPGQSPSTAPIPSSWSSLAPGEQPKVLLYRDTNSWCPFCERVWFALEEKGIPFETEFIDLSNKPQWYHQNPSLDGYKIDQKGRIFVGDKYRDGNITKKDLALKLEYLRQKICKQ